MSEDSSFNRDQRKGRKAWHSSDFFGSLGKGMLAKEKIETLGNSSGLTPLGFGVMKCLDNGINELENMKSDFVDSQEFQQEKNTEILKKLHQDYHHCVHLVKYIVKKEKSFLVEGFSANEGLETLEEILQD